MFHAGRTINALIEFEHERRALEAAMDDAAKVPGWERPRSDELALALDYGLYKLVEIAQIHLDSEQHRLFNMADLTPDEIATLDVGHDTDDQEGEPDGIDQEAP